MKKKVIFCLLFLVHCNVQAEENLLGKMELLESLESAKIKHELILMDKTLDKKNDYYIIKDDSKSLYGIPTAHRIFIFNNRRLIGVLIRTKGEKNWPILKIFAFHIFGGANTPASAYKDPKTDTEAYYWAGDKVIISAKYSPEEDENGTIIVLSIEAFLKEGK